MERNMRSWRFSVSPSLRLLMLTVCCTLLAFAAPRAAAQDEAPLPADDDAQAAADLELVSALERVVSRAIARAEKSVVSIARRKRTPQSPSPADSHPGIFSKSGGRDSN